jgi:Rad3-related DNA helicase
MKCCNPGFLFSCIVREKPVGLLLTSGTLSPLDTMESELQIPFQHQLKCPHVVNKSQVFATVVERSENYTSFNFSYAQRNNSIMVHELGQTLLDVTSRVRGGVLVFFPAYGLLKQYTDMWERSGVTAKLKTI